MNIAVSRYAGDNPNGLANRYADTFTPHTMDRELHARAREQGWTVLRHRPCGEKHRPGMSADAPVHQDPRIMADLIENADPSDWYYWGSASSDHMLELLKSDPATYAANLMRAAMLMKRLGGTHVLDHSAGYEAPGGAPASTFSSIVELMGQEWVAEPWRHSSCGWTGFCLERWYYNAMLVGNGAYRNTEDPAVRWWSGHTLDDDYLPWSGNVAHWLRHVTAHGHTPALNIEDIDLSVTADEFLERVSSGTK